MCTHLTRKKELAEKNHFIVYVCRIRATVEPRKDYCPTFTSVNGRALKFGKYPQYINGHFCVP